MFINVNRQLKFCNKETEAVLLISQAKKFIRTCKFGTVDLRLDKYLREFKKTTLRKACMSLLKQCKINKHDDCIIITFITKEANDLATLITYGNGPLIGSNILVHAFK